jgi:hypothetical protein
MKIQVMVFWAVTPCSDVVGYQHFGGPSCLTNFSVNDGILPHHYMVSQSRRPQLQYAFH